VTDEIEESPKHCLVIGEAENTCASALSNRRTERTNPLRFPCQRSQDSQPGLHSRQKESSCTCERGRQKLAAASSSTAASSGVFGLFELDGTEGQEGMPDREVSQTCN